MQTLTIKDIVYILTLATTIGSGIAAILIVRNQVSRLSRSVYDKDHGLNLVTVHSCKTHRDIVHQSIRNVEKRTDKAIDGLTTGVKIQNDRLLKIMIKLNIDTDK